MAGSPLTIFRLGPAGARVVDAIAAGADVGPAAQPLVDRLLDTGAAHPRPVGERYGPADVTVVIPVRDHDPRATLDALGPVGAVVVVDDGSLRPVVAPGASLLRHDRPLGPAAARHDRRGRRDDTAAGVRRRRLRPHRGLARSAAGPLRRRAGGVRRAPRRQPGRRPPRRPAAPSPATRRAAAPSTSARWRGASPRPPASRTRRLPRSSCAVRRWWRSAASTRRCGSVRTSISSGGWSMRAGGPATSPSRSSATDRGPPSPRSSASASATAARPGRSTAAIPARWRRSSPGPRPPGGGPWPRPATRSPARCSG